MSLWVIFTLTLSRRIFDALRSQCNNPLVCNFFIPLAIDSITHILYKLFKALSHLEGMSDKSMKFPKSPTIHSMTIDAAAPLMLTPHSLTSSQSHCHHLLYLPKQQQHMNLAQFEPFNNHRFRIVSLNTLR
jgi:hypothetical protein